MYWTKLPDDPQCFLGSPSFNSSGGFPGGSEGKESACNAGDLGLIPGLEDPLEKGMAIHSIILAWRIPWTEEPGGLQSMGLQRSWTRLSDQHFNSSTSSIAARRLN